MCIQRNRLISLSILVLWGGVLSPPPMHYGSVKSPMHERVKTIWQKHIYFVNVYENHTTSTQIAVLRRFELTESKWIIMNQIVKLTKWKIYIFGQDEVHSGLALPAPTVYRTILQVCQLMCLRTGFFLS